MNLKIPIMMFALLFGGFLILTGMIESAVLTIMDAGINVAILVGLYMLYNGILNGKPFGVRNDLFVQYLTAFCFFLAVIVYNSNGSYTASDSKEHAAGGVEGKTAKTIDTFAYQEHAEAEVKHNGPTNEEKTFYIPNTSDLKQTMRQLSAIVKENEGKNEFQIIDQDQGTPVEKPLVAEAIFTDGNYAPDRLFQEFRV